MRVGRRGHSFPSDVFNAVLRPLCFHWQGQRGGGCFQGQARHPSCLDHQAPHRALTVVSLFELLYTVPPDNAALETIVARWESPAL